MIKDYKEFHNKMVSFVKDCEVQGCLFFIVDKKEKPNGLIMNAVGESEELTKILGDIGVTMGEAIGGKLNKKESKPNFPFFIS